MQQQLWTIDDLARVLRVSRDAAYRLAQETDLPTIRIGRRRRWDPDAVRVWLHRRQTGRPRTTGDYGGPSGPGDGGRRQGCGALSSPAQPSDP